MYVIREPSGISFDRVGIRDKVFPTENLSPKAGFVLVSTETGHETTIIEHDSDFIFYVIDGHGYFEVSGIKEECSTGNLVIIPAKNAFTYKGKLKMLLICAPPWKEEQEEVLDNPSG